MSEPEAADIRVEVAYARPDVQFLVALTLPSGSTVATAVRQSGVLERFPDIDLNRQPVGIFARVCPLDQVLRDGDRVELYRPLTADPKTLRRQAAR